MVHTADQLEDLLEDIRQLEELLKEVGKGGAPTPAAPPAKGRKKSLQSPLDALRSINKALRTSKDKVCVGQTDELPLLVQLVFEKLVCVLSTSALFC